MESLRVLVCSLARPGAWQARHYTHTLGSPTRVHFCACAFATLWWIGDWRIWRLRVECQRAHPSL